MAKKVITGTDARLKMKEGVDILANAVKATLGPRGRNAAIETKYGAPIITKDGVTVARYIDLSDRVQNMGAQLIKSVASDANSEAGDGTTTATVLAQEIFDRGIKQVANGNNPVLVKRGIDLATSIVVKKLKELSLEVKTPELITQVATISANNDLELGSLIGQAVVAVGNDGIVMVEESTGAVTEVQYSDGIKIERGWLNENFINVPAKNTCEMKDPYIFLYDEDVKSINPLVPLLNELFKTDHYVLMVVKTIETEALAHLILNKVNHAFKCCVIRAPGFGDHRRAYLDDIATLTGAKVFTAVDTLALQNAQLTDLGRARSIVVGMNSTKIIDGAATPEQIETTISQLKNLLEQDSIFDHQKEIIRERISRLSGGVAIFKVGATSEGEMREKKDRVEDAINAVKSALAEGVVPGGGCALLHCIGSLEFDKSHLLDEEVIGIKIIKDSLSAPFNQILINAGVEGRSEYQRKIMESKTFSGYDALKLEYVENMLERGIVDPVKVVRSALEHAASAAGTLLTTEVLICEMVEDKKVS